MIKFISLVAVVAYMNVKRNNNYCQHRIGNSGADSCKFNICNSIGALCKCWADVFQKPHHRQYVAVTCNIIEILLIKKLMIQKKNLDWKIYESITKYIYETLGKEFGVKIKGYGSTCKVIGKSGVTHQIDVLTSHSDGIHSYETAIECKYWNQKVNKDIVMKLAEIIHDCGINKGIIVCKNGFTHDGIEYAKHKNIELVELREIDDKDLNENPKEIYFADLLLRINTTIRRTEILNIDIGDNRKIEVGDEFKYFDFIVMQENQSNKSLATYITEFRMDVNPNNEKTEKLTKHYEIPNGALYNKETKETLKINGITFTGQLKVTDDNRNLKFSLVDEVWLIMKSIFNERTFTFSESGLIKENKK